MAEEEKDSDNNQDHPSSSFSYPSSEMAQTLDPLYLLSSPSLTKGLGSVYTDNDMNANTDVRPVTSAQGFDVENTYRRKSDSHCLVNGSDVTKTVDREREKGIGRRREGERGREESDDDDVAINFTQFYHLIFKIAEIVYPEIYEELGSDSSSSTTQLSGPATALQKTIFVSFNLSD